MGKKGKDKSFGLSRSLAWIQEKNFEDKFEVVRVVGCVGAFARGKLPSERRWRQACVTRCLPPPKNAQACPTAVL